MGKVILIGISGHGKMGENAGYPNIGQLGNPQSFRHTAVHVLADGQPIAAHAGIDLQVRLYGFPGGNRSGGNLLCVCLVNQRNDKVLLNGQCCMDRGDGTQYQDRQLDACFTQFHALLNGGDPQNFTANPFQLSGNLYGTMTIRIALDNTQYVACRSGPCREFLKV